jgi:sugar phosphate isomerase/epimerase
MNKIFTSSGAFKNFSNLENLFNYLNKNKIKNVELSGGSYNKNYKNILSKNKNINFLFHNYFPVPKNSFVINLASNNKKIIKHSFDHIKKAIRLSKLFNLKYFSIHSGFLYDPAPKFLGKKMKLCKTFDRKKALSRFIKNINKIGEYAEKNEITILLENNNLEKYEYNLFKKSTVLMATSKETTYIMKKTKDNIRLLVDVGHLKVASNTLKFSKTNFLKNCSKWIEGYQLSDNYGLKDDNLPVKYNSWFWPHIKKNLKYYSLEVYNQKMVTIKKNLKLIKDKIN